jgi:nucleotide-binding universal stress UspA family protein
MRAVRSGSAIAARSRAAFEVVAVTDAGLPSQPLRAAGEPTDWSEVLEGHMRGLATEQLKAAGIEEATIHTPRGRPATTIVEMADSTGADLLVLGAHHKPDFSRFLLGSTSEKVARLTDVPVLIATETASRRFERILVAVDNSPQSRAVLDAAAAFGQMDGAAVRVLYVWEPMHPLIFPQHTVGAVPPPTGVAEAMALNEARREQEHAQFDSLLADADDAYEVKLQKGIREGQAGHEIVEDADEWDADLLVIGTHGAGFFDRLLMGSTSLHVLRHSERTTLLVPRNEQD